MQCAIEPDIEPDVRAQHEELVDAELDKDLKTLAKLDDVETQRRRLARSLEKLAQGVAALCGELFTCGRTALQRAQACHDGCARAEAAPSHEETLETLTRIATAPTPPLPEGGGAPPAAQSRLAAPAPRPSQGHAGVRAPGCASASSWCDGTSGSRKRPASPPAASSQPRGTAPSDATVWPKPTGATVCAAAGEPPRPSTPKRGAACSEAPETPPTAKQPSKQPAPPQRDGEALRDDDENARIYPRPRQQPCGAPYDSGASRPLLRSPPSDGDEPLVIDGEEQASPSAGEAEATEPAPPSNPPSPPAESEPLAGRARAQARAAAVHARTHTPLDPCAPGLNPTCRGV